MGFGIDGIALYIFGVPIWFIYRIIIRVTRKSDVNRISKEILYFVFYLYVLTILSLTLFPIYFNSYPLLVDRLHGNFIPFTNTIKDIIRSKNDPFMVRFWLKNILGNLIILFPLGILLPLLQNKYDNIIRVTLFGFMLSLGIEVIQFFSVFIGNNKRVFDIDDIIFNVLGVFLGIVTYTLTKPIINALRVKHSV